MDEEQIHTLEFLLNFDGRLHWYEQGYFLKFAIRRVDKTPERPHGLRYSFTLHDPDAKRIMGFDNAHSVPSRGRKTRRPEETDHWHRTGNDPGRPYAFTDAATLLGDFFDEVARILTERGVPIDVVKEGTDEERQEP